MTGEFFTTDADEAVDYADEHGGAVEPAPDGRHGYVVVDGVVDYAGCLCPLLDRCPVHHGTIRRG